MEPQGPHRSVPLAPRVRAELVELWNEVRELVRVIETAERENAAAIARVRPRHRDSATNLVHYVALRGHDVRPLQLRLAAYGLSSLGRMESQVRHSLHLVELALARLTGQAVHDPLQGAAPVVGDEQLAANATALLGPHPEDRVARIMVTMPSEAATDAELVDRMVERGMDVARINCAHDGPDAWDAMIRNIRRAAARHPGPTGIRRHPIAMDLAGPKLRTGPIEPGPPVVKVKPVRSATGEVTEPGLVEFAPGHGPGEPVPLRNRIPPRVYVEDEAWLHALRPGARIGVTDARGSRRELMVEKAEGGSVLASTTKTAYLVPGLELHSAGTSAAVGWLPAPSRFHLVRPGDRIILTRALDPAPVLEGGPHRIGCSLPQVFQDARPGHRISFDDGKISGVIETVTADEIGITVGSAGVAGVKLRAEKGINLPDTELSMPALTDEDLHALDYVAHHADIVNYSFVRTPEDVAHLLSEVTARGRADLDIVLKIETVAAFRNLPQILLEAMRWEDIGVMIARGDLAVEAGFERLAEVQEQILWLCEAGHVPVIWATQVLDTMARTGLPSRAEVTDAAMADRAECVMLNKGPFIVEAIGFLSGILGRMREHTAKKRNLLRRLRSWDLEPE